MDDKGQTQKGICDAMVAQLWVYLDQSGTELKFDKFCESIENWVNKETAQKKFIFEILDTYHIEKVSVNSMFMFMQQMTKALPTKKNPKIEILSLNQTEVDMFLDVFSADFCRLVAALNAKRKLVDKI